MTDPSSTRTDSTTVLGSGQGTGGGGRGGQVGTSRTQEGGRPTDEYPGSFVYTQTTHSSPPHRVLDRTCQRNRGTGPGAPFSARCAPRTPGRVPDRRVYLIRLRLLRPRIYFHDFRLNRSTPGRGALHTQFTPPGF